MVICFLKTGWTRACFQTLGTWLVCRDLVKRRESAGAISSATCSPASRVSLGEDWVLGQSLNHIDVFSGKH